MRFETKEDVEAPIDHVFAQLSDFAGFERSAMRRGADVTRLDTLDTPGVGMKWRISFKLRGKKRKIDLELTEFDAPNQMVFAGTSPNLSLNGVVELVALSKNRTRMAMSVELQPKTLSARLFVQSMKLAKGKMEKRLKVRVSDFAKDMEEGYKATV